MRLPLFFTFVLTVLAGWIAWERAGMKEWWGHRHPTEKARPLDPGFLRLSAVEITRLPLAARFDYPMGSAHAALTYNAQPFLTTRHLGDDLNGIGGGNSDRGDPVYAAGAGLVAYAGIPGPGWGNMIILAHRVPDLENPGQEKICQTVYAHLENMWVKTGQQVRRGENIGSVGTAGGQYLAHLHFEVREGPYINPAQGYADSALNRLSPEKFIRQRRGAPAAQMNPPPQ